MSEQGGMLSRLFGDVFPSLLDSSIPGQCWVAKSITIQRPELGVFSDALEVVERYGELGALKKKLKPLHPVNDEHDVQFDERVRDCLTEACAFAWADLRGLGAPQFSLAEGTPDILLDTGRWIEVKAIHGSQVDAKRTNRMLAGEVVSGQVTPPESGLYGKFESSLMNAMRKFARQGHQKPDAPKET